jgi:hypothetical protein
MQIKFKLVGESTPPDLIPELEFDLAFDRAYMTWWPHNSSEERKFTTFAGEALRELVKAIDRLARITQAVPLTQQKISAEYKIMTHEGYKAELGAVWENGAWKCHFHIGRSMEFRLLFGLDPTFADMAKLLSAAGVLDA